MSAALAAAMVLDALLGEPRWLWSRLPHPAVLAGKAVVRCDSAFNRGPRRRLTGVIVMAALVAAAWVTGLAIAALPLGWLWQALGAAILLAQRSLSQHVRAVADALDKGLDPARRAVAMIVGRDTASMTEPQIARAAIESAAENFSDGVVAPAVFFLIGGLPAMLVYKLVNTADSTIGYLTDRHRDFGWAAARLDDVLNWVPARLAALLIAASHLRLPVRAVAADARRHRSPNAGWPEAAMAQVLDVALAGPRSYHGAVADYPLVHATGARDAGRDDIRAADRAIWRAWALGLAIVIYCTVA